MKCHRLVVEMGEEILSIDLHPRITVLSGLEPFERTTLAAELTGALVGDRSGVHVEVRDSNDRRLAILRPRGGRHRVIDVDAELDVTHEFAGAGGDVDLVARAGYGGPEGLARLVVDHLPRGAQLANDPREIELARVEQRTLWGAAENVRRTAKALGSMASSANAVMSEQRLVDEVEHAHRRLEEAVLREERSTGKAYKAALAGAGLSVPLGLYFPLAAIPSLGLAALSMGFIHQCRRRIAASEHLEAEALALAGAQSYLGFHLQRVNGMLSSAETRRRLSAAADLHRKALATWHSLVGDVPVDWAFDHQAAIVATALVEVAVGTHPGVLNPNDRPWAEALASLLTDTPRGNGDDDTLPLLLNEPFAAHDASTTRRLLDQLARWSGLRQVILFTGDQNVRDWAAAEATLGRVHLVEAQPIDSRTIDLSVGV